MYLRDKGQILVGTLVFMMPILLGLFFAVELCEYGSYHMRVQKVTDEASLKSTQVQVKGLQFLALTNHLLLTLHISLRGLEALVIAGGISAAAAIPTERILRKMIFSLANIQDKSIPLFLAASLLVVWKMKSKFSINAMRVKPVLVGGQKEAENTLQYHIKRKKFLDLPGPYVLEKHFKEKQKVEVSSQYFYKSFLLKQFFNTSFLEIRKKAKIGIEGKNLLSFQWKTVFLK